MTACGKRRTPAEIEPSIAKILEVACDFFGVGPSKLLGPSRILTLNRQRIATLAAIRVQTSWSHAAIASAFGRYDHTTSINAVARAASDPELARWRDAIVAETQRSQPCHVSAP